MNAKKPLSRSKLAVLAAHQEGLTQTEIGSRLGVSRQRIHQIYHELSLTPTLRVDQVQARRAGVAAHFKKGLGAIEISKEMGLPLSVVQQDKSFLKLTDGHRTSMLRRKLIEQLSSEGLKGREIAGALGIGIKTVVVHRKRLGLSRSMMEMRANAQIRRQKVAELFARGLTDDEIAMQLDIPTGYVYNDRYALKLYRDRKTSNLHEV